MKAQYVRLHVSLGLFPLLVVMFKNQELPIQDRLGCPSHCANSHNNWLITLKTILGGWIIYKLLIPHLIGLLFLISMYVYLSVLNT